MDNHTKEQRHKNMASIRSKDTKIEVLLRTALFHAGIKYRKNYNKLTGRPDIAITKYKIAVFCDSAFFHGKDYDTTTKPKTNADFWEKKIRRNMERDKEVNAALKEQGWTVMRFWDEDITKHTGECVQAILDEIERKQ